MLSSICSVLLVFYYDIVICDLLLKRLLTLCIMIAVESSQGWKPGRCPKVLSHMDLNVWRKALGNSLSTMEANLK